MKARSLLLHVRRSLAALVLVAGTAGTAVTAGIVCTACKDPAPPPSPGTPSTASIRWPDAGLPSFANGDQTVRLPSGELAKGAHPAVVQDSAGKRFAYEAAGGATRLVYTVGPHLYLGPKMKGPVDFTQIPDRDHALGTLFDMADTNRKQLVADVKGDGGDAAVAKLLEEGAYVDGPEWDAAYRALPEASASEVRTTLAKTLGRTEASAGLKRAVLLVPLTDPKQAPALAARIRELAKDVREPRASAVMLRALIRLDKKEASAVGCEVLGNHPLDLKKATGTPQEVDAAGRDALAEAAALAIANEGVECTELPTLLDNEKICQPFFRCGPNGPLNGRETSKQDEPLCTKEQLVPLLAQELQRPATDVIALDYARRTPLFAYTALLEVGKAPDNVALAHARRRYELTEPASPPCDTSGKIGTPCHCDEAMVRDQTCRHVDQGGIAVSTCRWDVDDNAKKLANVTLSAPP